MHIKYKEIYAKANISNVIENVIHTFLIFSLHRLLYAICLYILRVGSLFLHRVE